MTQSLFHTREGGLVDNFLSYYNRGVREKITRDVMAKIGRLLHEDGYTLSVACGWDRRGDVRVDLHPGAVGRTVRADAQALPFSDESFDNVLGLAFLHHIKNYHKAVKEIVRVVKIGGRVLLMEPSLFHPHSIHFTHMFGLTRERPIYANKVRWALSDKCELLADETFFGLRFAHFFFRHYDTLVRLGKAVPRQLQGYFVLIAQRTK